MRNSDPGMSVVFVQRRNSDLNSLFTIQATSYRILVHFPLLLVRCKTWFGQIKLYWIPVILIHGIHGYQEYRLSVPARFLSSRYQS